MSWGRAFRLPLLTLSLICACGDGQTSDAAASDATESPGVTQPPASPSLPSAAGANSVHPGTNPAQRTAAPPAGTNGQAGAAGRVAEAGAAAPELTPLGPGMCCPDGDCLCRAEPPSALSAAPGPHNFMQYAIVVAYVAPHSYGSNDPRYVTFLEHVGTQSCREKLIALQRDVLMRRSEMFPRFQQQASSMGLTFEAIGIEAAFEHVVQEFRVAFWQYGSLADCDSLPQPGASVASALGAITAAVPLSLGADQTIRSVRVFETYYYQAAVEYGQYGPLEEHLEDLLQHRGTYTMEKYAPQVPSLKFVPETAKDIGDWVKNEAEHIIFVYGEIDPWTAGAFEIDPTRDLHSFIVPGASHGANLAARSLPPESRALALQVLERWTGVAPRALTEEELALQEQGQELYFQLPPQHLRF